MKGIFASIVILFAFGLTFAQNEQSPIVQKDISYKNWTFKDARTGADRTLRDLTIGKKLVIVVYFAPWCGNWKHDEPFLQRFYDKYKSDGLEIVGVGEYGTPDAIRSNLDTYKITFPIVYESQDRADKMTTQHYAYRRSTGDGRNWGSPWYVLLDPSKFSATGDILIKRTHIINGEMIEPEGEKFVREKLGLPAVETKAAVAKEEKVEVCDPAKPSAAPLKKPQ
jgi:thiol-disulfide isomerase/thioredoxin